MGSIPVNTEGGELRIEGRQVRSSRMPLGIGLQFQFRILEHPNSRYSEISIPILNSKTQYLHPNAIKSGYDCIEYQTPLAIKSIILLLLVISHNFKPLQQ